MSLIQDKKLVIIIKCLTRCGRVIEGTKEWIEGYTSIEQSDRHIIKEIEKYEVYV